MLHSNAPDNDIRNHFNHHLPRVQFFEQYKYQILPFVLLHFDPYEEQVSAHYRDKNKHLFN